MLRNVLTGLSLIPCHSDDAVCGSTSFILLCTYWFYFLWTVNNFGISTFSRISAKMFRLVELSNKCICIVLRIAYATFAFLRHSFCYKFIGSIFVKLFRPFKLSNKYNKCRSDNDVCDSASFILP